MKFFAPINSRKFPELDTFRFFAVTLVLGHHLFFKNDFIFSWLYSHGYSGVDLFFTLSGFIITYGLMNEWNKNGCIGLKNFWTRRVLRLWPSLYLTLFITSVVVFSFGTRNSEIMIALKQKGWHYFFHFGNYSYVYSGKLHTLFGHLWSLAVEEHFYLLWPLLFIIIKKIKHFCWILFPILIFVPYLFRVQNKALGLENLINTFSTHTRFDALAFGCLFALIFEKLPELKSRFGSIILWIIGISIFQLG